MTPTENHNKEYQTAVAQEIATLMGRHGFHVVDSKSVRIPVWIAQILIGAISALAIAYLALQMNGLQTSDSEQRANIRGLSDRMTIASRNILRLCSHFPNVDCQNDPLADESFPSLSINK